MLVRDSCGINMQKVRPIEGNWKVERHQGKKLHRDHAGARPIQRCHGRVHTRSTLLVRGTTHERPTCPNEIGVRFMPRAVLLQSFQALRSGVCTSPEGAHAESAAQAPGKRSVSDEVPVGDEVVPHFYPDPAHASPKSAASAALLAQPCMFSLVPSP